MAEATASHRETHERLGGSGIQTLKLVAPDAGRVADGGRAAAANEQPSSRGRRALTEIAAQAAGRAAGVASLAESVHAPGSAGDRAHGVIAVSSPDGQRQDLQVFVRAYLGNFLELGWAVRDAIRTAAAAQGLDREIGLIDVQVVALVLPIEEMPAA